MALATLVLLRSKSGVLLLRCAVQDHL
jgi:hypothetical protein